MSKIKLVQIAIAASLDDTWETLALDNIGRLWRIDNHDKFYKIELPDEPGDLVAEERGEK